jgi:hypothetical protein
VRFVHARDEVARVLVLALRPGLQRTVFDLLVRGQKIQAALGLGAVIDAQLAPLRQPLNDQGVAVVAVACRLEARAAIDADALELEAHGVHLQAVGAWCHATKIEHGAATDRLGLEIQRQIHEQVLYAIGARAFVLAFGARQAERAAPCGASAAFVESVRGRHRAGTILGAGRSA